MTRELLDAIMAININRCCGTTYDQGVAECVRQEIVKALAADYNIQYNFQPKGVTIFPVDTGNLS
jgi:hypothetical protein